MNMSNASGLSTQGMVVTFAISTYDSAVGLWLFSTNWILSIISPISSFVGLPACIMIIICMTSAKINKKTKIFYVAIALFTLAPLIFTHLLSLFVNCAISFISGGTVIFFFANAAPLACQIALVAVAAGESGAAYITAAFAVERYIAVRYPFRAHSLTLRQTATCVTVIAVCSIALNCIGFYAYVPAAPLSTVLNFACTPRADAAIIMLPCWCLMH
jgi:hypothetical protein